MACFCSAREKEGERGAEERLIWKNGPDGLVRRMAVPCCAQTVVVCNGDSWEMWGKNGALSLT